MWCNRYKAGLILIAVLIFYGFIVACSKQNTFSETRFLLGTDVEIKVIAKNKPAAQRAINTAFSEIEGIEKITSSFIEGNELALLNKAGSSGNCELFNIIDESLYFSRLTNGAFDITVSPLIKLWGFKIGKHKVPTDSEIKEILKIVGYQRIILDYKNKKVYLNKSRIDLGGIAKGYAIDNAIKVLKTSGIKKGLVNAGGDIRFIGDKTWSIGIQHPRMRSKLVKKIKLKNRAIVTSGDYERYFVENNKRYHHIINPVTGYPATECVSITVIANDALSADALATGLFVLGVTRGMRLIESLKDTEAIIIDSDGNIFTSEGIKD